MLVEMRMCLGVLIFVDNQWFEGSLLDTALVGIIAPLEPG